MSDANVAALSSSDKIGEALKRSLPLLAPEARDALKSVLTPEALAVMAAITVSWVAAHFVGVGEAIDIILCVIGVFAVGLAVFDGVDHIWKFASIAYTARNDADLDEAAKNFAQAVAILGVQAVLAILFKNRPRSYRGKPVNVGPPPGQAGSPFLAKPGLMSTRAMTAGEGATSAWGDIVISRLGTQTDRRLAAIHESVHRFLTPRLGVLRNVRVISRARSYSRSALSKFLEEAVAETVAQVSVNGFRSVFRGIYFPVQNRYVTLLRIDGRTRPFLPEAGGLVAGGFMLYGMIFEIWDTPRPPREPPLP
jgi:hypothetical protein